MKTIAYNKINESEEYLPDSTLNEDVSLAYEMMPEVEKRNPLLKFTYDKNGIYDVELSDGNTLRKIYNFNNQYLLFKYPFTRICKSISGSGDLIQFFENSRGEYVQAIICGHTGKLLIKNPGEEFIDTVFAYNENGKEIQAALLSDSDPLLNPNETSREGIYKFDGTPIKEFGTLTSTRIVSTEPFLFRANRRKGHRISPNETLFDSKGNEYYTDNLLDIHKLYNSNIYDITLSKGLRSLFDADKMERINDIEGYDSINIFDAKDFKGECKYAFLTYPDKGEFVVFRIVRNGNENQFIKFDDFMDVTGTSIIPMDLIRSNKPSPSRALFYTPRKKSGFHWSNALMSDGSKLSEVDFKIADHQNPLGMQGKNFDMTDTDLKSIYDTISPKESESQTQYDRNSQYYLGDSSYSPFHFILYEGSTSGNEKWNVLDMGRMKMVYDEPLDGVRCVKAGPNYYIILKKGGKYNLMMGNQYAVDKDKLGIDFEERLLFDEWVDGVYITTGDFCKHNDTAAMPELWKNIIVEKNSKHYIVGPFTDGSCAIPYEHLDAMSSRDSMGRAVFTEDQVYIMKPVANIENEKGPAGKYIPFVLIGPVDGIYDLGLTSPIVEMDGKYGFLKPVLLTKSDVTLDDLMVSCGDAGKWFDDAESARIEDGEDGKKIIFPFTVNGERKEFEMRVPK